MRVLAACTVAAALLAGTADAAPARSCSAAGLSASVAPQKLPPAAAAKRRAIVAAAVSCDYARLARLAGKSFRFSFGGEASPATFWRNEEASGHPVLATLVKLLRLPYTRNEAGSYAWPSAYRERPSRADWDALVRAGVLTRAAADRQRKGGNVYYGYRLAITPRGVWQFYVAGD